MAPGCPISRKAGIHFFAACSKFHRRPMNGMPPSNRASRAGGLMRLIATGGAGFIGSAFVCNAVRDGHDVLTIDKLTYAGRREALAEVLASPRHRFLQADI